MKKGDRVKLSNDGIKFRARNVRNRHSASLWKERRGTIVGISVSGIPIIHWDGNSPLTRCAMHKDFLESA